MSEIAHLFSCTQITNTKVQLLLFFNSNIIYICTIIHAEIEVLYTDAEIN